MANQQDKVSVQVSGKYSFGPDNDCEMDFNNFTNLAAILEATHGQDVSSDMAEDTLGLNLAKSDEEELAELLSLALDETDDDLPYMPPADLSFLSAAREVDSQSLRAKTDVTHTDAESLRQWAAKPLFFLDNARKLCIELSHELLTSWQEYGAITPSHMLQPGFVSARRNEDDVLYAYSLDDLAATGSDAYQQIDLRIIRNPENPEQSEIYATIMLNNRNPLDMDSTEVTLKYKQQVIDTKWTDGLGQVIFSDVKSNHIADFVLEITPDE